MNYALERLAYCHVNGIGNTKERGCLNYKWKEIALSDDENELIKMLDKHNPLFQYGGRVKERYGEKVIAQINQ